MLEVDDISTHSKCQMPCFLCKPCRLTTSATPAAATSQTLQRHCVNGIVHLKIPFGAKDAC